MAQLAPVLAFSSRHEAELAKSFLSAYSFPAHLQTDDCGCQNPFLAATHEVSIAVRESDLLQVEAILDAIDAEYATLISDEPEVDALRREMWKSIKGVIAACFFLPAFLQPFALRRAILIMNRIQDCSDSTETMRKTITITVAFSTFLTLLFIFKIAILLADVFL